MDRDRHHLPRLVATLCFVCAAAAAAEVYLEDGFERDAPGPWVSDPVPGIRTAGMLLTALGTDEHCLCGQARGQFLAMGLPPGALKPTLRVQAFPRFRWRWRISNLVEGADATCKSADDFPARLYVVFASTSAWRPWAVRVLVYVWDNRQAPGTILPNTWAPKRERVIVARSGADSVGLWVQEDHDVARDFHAAFPGQEPGRVRAVVFASDTDQTGASVVACFDDLRIETRR